MMGLQIEELNVSVFGCIGLNELPLASDRKKNVDVITQPNGSVVITMLARNMVIATLVTLVGGLPAFGCLLIALIGIAEGQLDTALIFVGACACLSWVVWRFGWRKKRYEICFDDVSIHFGVNTVAYAEFSEIVVDFNGGAPYDPGSMPVPRNGTPGYHVAIKARGQLIPITATMSRTEAFAVRDASIAVWEHFTSSLLKDHF
ncbi:hypothetical protein [Loktanella sp. PT4BL]|uniref:hypothetical protein n=1 Tax=Loktanella sp. PT4BL TaxID=2135611 RepID=UPI0011B6F9D1|nr:hypothetical protein [Loktanella sp. PT4BL]